MATDISTTEGENDVSIKTINRNAYFFKMGHITTSSKWIFPSNADKLDVNTICILFDQSEWVLLVLGEKKVKKRGNLMI
jgi:hypothetical protein